MSHNYNDRYQQMQENDPTPAVDHSGKDRYATPGHSRSICFVWPDGHKLLLSYTYLIAAEYLDSSIMLTFTSHFIQLTGIRLETLFTELMEQLPRIITATDTRYGIIADDNAPLVREITANQRQ